MESQLKEKNGIVIITLQGEMVGGPDATAMNEQIRSLIAAGKTKIIADLKNVSFMNSSGLGILIGAVHKLRKNGGDLKLLHLADKPAHVMKITKLDRVFSIFENEEQAIASFSES